MNTIVSWKIENNSCQESAFSLYKYKQSDYTLNVYITNLGYEKA